MSLQYQICCFTNRAWKTDIKGAPEGILLGKSVAVKDTVPVAGVPMCNGSFLLEGYTPDFDATIITKVLEAGKLWTVFASLSHSCSHSDFW